MVSYAAFLRSINVGKHNRIRMEELRSLLASLGLEEPRSYLQSGNLTFRSSLAEEEVAQTIERVLADRDFRGASVMVRQVAELQALVERDPFATHDPDVHYRLVAFLRSRAEPLDPFPFAIKKATVIGGDSRTLLAIAPKADGMQSQPTAAIESRWKTQVTIRFWNVVQDFAAFCG